MARYRLALAPLALAGTLALAGCNSMQQDNFGACTQALFAAHTSSPTKLLSVALATPACAALGSELLNELLNSVTKQQAARGVRP